MTFKFRRGFQIPYKRQGIIYFSCQNFAEQPPEVQKKIQTLCRDCGKEYEAAIFEAVTTERNLQPIADDYHMSQCNLWKMVKKFYNLW